MLVAAGEGTRLGRGPKALVRIAGRSILDHALDHVLAASPDQVIVAAPPGVVATDAVSGIAAGRAHAVTRIRVVDGGATRQQSVGRALDAVDAGTEVVLVHDAARPFTPAAQFLAVRDAVLDRRAGVVPALPMTDTVKRVTGGTVTETVDRAPLVRAQTPQGFPFAEFHAALRAAEAVHTDDAALYQAAGGRVVIVPGHPDAFKITTPDDLARAARVSAPAPQRIGTGVDVHAFDATTPLRLGGLDWPNEAGLSGHSDGDAACHAIADALLTAAGQGDLGAVFGTDRPEEAGRPGLDFVHRAVDRIRAAGFVPVSVSLQVIGNRPRIAPRRGEMEQVLSAAVGAPVAVSGTTTDGLGFTGRGEGVTAMATALVMACDDADPSA